MPDMERVVEGSTFESLDSVVKIEESSGGRPQMICGIHATAFVLTTPLPFMKASHRLRQVLPSDISFGPQLRDQLIGVRRLNELHQLQTAGRERVDDTLVGT